MNRHQTPRSLHWSQEMASRRKREFRSTLASVPQPLVKCSSSRGGAVGSLLMLGHCRSPTSSCLFFYPVSPQGVALHSTSLAPHWFASPFPQAHLGRTITVHDLEACQQLLSFARRVLLTSQCPGIYSSCSGLMAETYLRSLLKCPQRFQGADLPDAESWEHNRSPLCSGGLQLMDGGETQCCLLLCSLVRYANASTDIFFEGKKKKKQFFFHCLINQ